jgi:hypothetical protein
MKLLEASTGALEVLDASQPSEAMLDGLEDAGAAAYRFEDRWYLFQAYNLELLRIELEAGRSPGELLRDHPEAAIVQPGARPSMPALVFDGNEVVGAWIFETIATPAAPVTVRPSATKRRFGRVQDILYGDFRRSRAPSAPAPESAPMPESEGASGSAAPPPPPGGPPPPDGGGPSPPTEVETVVRTPHLDAPEKIPRAPGTTFTVSVFADTEHLRDGEVGKGIELELPPEVDQVEVGVLLQLTDHFESLRSGDYAQLTISRDQPRSDDVSFEIGVVDNPPGGTAVISALLTLRGRSCGQIARAWAWDADGPEAPPTEPAVSAPVSVPLHVKAEEPELSIFVTAPEHDGIHYHCAVQTPLLPEFARTQSEPFAVPAGGYEFMKALLEGVTGADTPGGRLRALKVVGNEAWEAAPPIVKKVLWALVDAGSLPATINIASAEPVLPWELMIPRRFDGKEPRRLGPLGVEFAIGRWTRLDGQEPPPKLPVLNSFVVAPVYGPSGELDSGPEIDYVVKHLRGTRVSPATISDLDGHFGTQHASLLHFVCHGNSGVEGDDLILLDGAEPLKARETEVLEGFEALFQATHPIVFLNSCNTGQAVPSLAGGSGFPRSFGNLGAHAVIAPLWPVGDQLAKEIALEIYDKALQPDAPPIASILQEIRKRGYEAEDVDTYAAYCFFGDPLARLELVAPPAAGP